MNLKLLLIISVLSVTACGSRQKVEPLPEVRFVEKWRTFDCGVPPERDFIELSAPAWVITDGLFTLTSEEYAKLGESVSDIIKATKQMANVIQFYVDCIEAAQEKESEDV